MAGGCKTLNKAFAKRIAGLLIKNNMSKYRLEKESGLTHSALRHIFNKKDNKDIKLSSVAKGASVFGMSLSDFLDDKIFDLAEIDFS